jgi:hypothetical protein
MVEELLTWLAPLVLREMAMGQCVQGEVRLDEDGLEALVLMVLVVAAAVV